MKTTTAIAAILTTVVGVAASGAAFAQEKRVTDLAYLQAVRCEGLAIGSRQPDPAISAFVKEAEGWRSSGARNRGDQILADAKHEGARNKPKAQAELAGACQAFRAPAATPAN
jgi:hypothetical protein